MVARRIADAVALAKRDGSLPIRTGAFAQLVAKAKGKEYQKMHPAKMTFQVCVLSLYASLKLYWFGWN